MSGRQETSLRGIDTNGQLSGVYTNPEVDIKEETEAAWDTLKPTAEIVEIKEREISQREAAQAEHEAELARLDDQPAVVRRVRDAATRVAEATSKVVDATSGLVTKARRKRVVFHEPVAADSRQYMPRGFVAREATNDGEVILLAGGIINSRTRPDGAPDVSLQINEGLSTTAGGKALFEPTGSPTEPLKQVDEDPRHTTFDPSRRVRVTLHNGRRASRPEQPTPRQRPGRQ